VVTHGTKRSVKAPEPTLATTRQRHSDALNVAYLNQPNGYHIKRVVHRAAPPPPSPIPYLSDQDNIPRSDDEDSDRESTAPTVPEFAVPIGVPDINMDVDADPEDDYDAEGETDDELMEDYPRLSSSFADRVPSAAREHPTLQTWPAASAYTNDLIGNASEEDLQALFGGLNDFPAGFSADFPTDFPVDSTISTSQGLGANIQQPEVFAMGQLHAAVDNLEAFGSLQDNHVASHLAPPPAPVPVDHLLQPLPTPRSSLVAASQTATPAPALDCPLGLPSPVACPSPLSCHVNQSAAAPCLGTPIDLVSTHRAPDQHPSTRDLVATAQSARSPSLALPPPPIPSADFGPELLRRPPLRRSLNIPDFLRDEDGNSSPDENRTRPPTPVALEDTDVGLDESSSPPVTQARTRAVRLFNFRVTHRRSSSSPPRILTVLDLQVNAAKVYRPNHQRSCHRQPTTTQPARRRNILSSGELTSDQRAVIMQMEFHVLKDIVTRTPWPTVIERDRYMRDAEMYAMSQTGVYGNQVFTLGLSDTVFSRMPGGRSGSLAKIQCMMEHEFDISSGNKKPIFQLMDKDQFLFPDGDRDPSMYFFVNAFGCALEIILFKCSKPIGLAFMEELCQPDDPERCANWHCKLRDRSACKGLPPGLLALAATQMYWALEKMYMNSTVHFDETHYRGVWECYFRVLLKLPHLSRLRTDMLDRIKEYYMAHWPVQEPDSDNESFPAW
ncbi:hypothetical protein FRC06_006337, partial [Ceratobasidium sp. 370]